MIKSTVSTTESSKKVSPNDGDSNRQPDVAILPLKPEILISGITIDRIEIPAASLGFFDLNKF